MSGELFKATLTAVVGIMVFVLGQIVQRIFLEPIQEQRKVIGEIAYALLMYGNVDHVAQRNAEGLTLVELETPLSVVKAIRGLGARFLQTKRVIPMYSVFAFLRIVPSDSDARRAMHGLTGWSNSIYHGDPDPHKRNVAIALRIPLHDDLPPPLPRNGMIRSVRE